MRTVSPRVIVVTCAAFGAGAALALFGFGPLDPPNGPITSSYKTLSEVEPRIAINASNTPGDADSKFKITQAGSYYLTGNITGVSGKAGIEVVANCTIDLNGFELTGVNGSLDGIMLVGQFRGTVRNGRVLNWGGNGIFGGNCDSSMFEDLVVVSNLGSGLWVGKNSIVSRVRAWSNGEYGVRTEVSCAIVECVGASNKLSGILAGSYSMVSRCITPANSEHGISSLNGGNVSDCVAYNNASAGIRTGGGIVRDSVCDGNVSFNIYVAGTGGASVTNNTCSNSPGRGIYCQSGANRLEANLLRSNFFGVTLLENGHSLMVGNFAVANSTAYDLYAGNDYGQMLADPGQIDSHVPWINFIRFP